MDGFVLLSSYPKSGNTWLRAVLESLRTGSRDVDINGNLAGIRAAADRDTFDRLMGVEASELTPMEIAWARPRLWDLVARYESARESVRPWIKMHDALLPPWPGFEPPITPDSIEAVVYIVRDPRDVAVSFAHHFGLDMDATIACMADTRAFLDSSTHWLPEQLPQMLSSWSLHVESWLDAPGIRRHAVRYEDMHADPETVFAGAARFLDLDASPESITRAIAAGRFEMLRAQEDRTGFRESEPQMDRFFRRGVAGGWRDTLTADQAERIARDHGSVMSRLGYEA